MMKVINNRKETTMKRIYRCLLATGIATLINAIFLTTAAQEKLTTYCIEHEQTIGKDEPGPHDGGGTTTVYKFFGKVEDCKLIFRKRILHPGSSIGWHTQTNDRAYYVVSGTGLMQMKAETLQVHQGDAILTRAGGWHSLKQAGNEDLILLISYQQP
jgi:mannose-6-phosphate isomerase-like protein (cupin superfamily)